VLAELEGEPVDAIVLGGDLVAGPHPRETLARLRALPGEVHWVRGNHERELVDAELLGRCDWELAIWAAAQLTGEERAWLGALPFSTELELPLGRVFFCHATPRSDEEFLTLVSRQEVYEAALAGVDADLVVAGHTHAQDDRAVGAVRFVNAGSVGMPFEGSEGAFWTLLGEEVEPRRTVYDVDAAVAALPPGLPDADAMVANCWRGGLHRRAVAREFERQAGR
jgi:predicted phosphodiesterase